MNRSDQAGRGVDCTHRQEAERWRRVENDNTVIRFDLGKCELQPLEKDRTGRRFICQDPQCFVLILHDFEVARNKVNAVEIGFAKNVTNGPPHVFIIPQGCMDRFVRPDVNFRLGSEKR